MLGCRSPMLTVKQFVGNLGGITLLTLACFQYVTSNGSARPQNSNKRRDSIEATSLQQNHYAEHNLTANNFENWQKNQTGMEIA